MKYKVGDKVRIKSREWYEKNKDEYGSVLTEGNRFVSDMTKFLGLKATIKKVGVGSKGIDYSIDIDNGYWCWNDEMFEGLVSDEKPLISAELIKDIAEVVKTHNLGVSISENEGKLIVEPLKVEEEKDLPIDTPVMCSYDGKTWDLHYYFMRKRVYMQGYKSCDARGDIPKDYIVPFDKFNPNNIEESLKYNIVK